MENEMNCVSVKITTPCSTCGTVLPINGLISETSCPKCFTVREIDMAVWKDIVNRAVHDGQALEMDRPESFTWKTGSLSKILSYRLEYSNTIPKDKNDISIDVNEAMQCTERGYYLQPANGVKISIRSFPDEFGGALPRARKVKHEPRKPLELFVLGEDFSRISRREPGTVEALPADTLQALKCSECGSALDVSGDDRNIRCRHCGTFFFISSSLWQRMYPDMDAITWYFLIK